MSTGSIHVVLGTAGHIDHGKTTLVRQLTGIDTDRLPEERRRGITISLGFAPLDLPSGVRVGVVDVPGHERFVRTMVAGAGGIDLALLVVAADEGLMPQTQEHLEICQLLEIPRLIVAMTKVDRADRDLCDLVEEDLRSRLSETAYADASIRRVSAVTGQGIPELIEHIDRQARALESQRTEAALLLPIDRAFTIAGFGTVVTGTLSSGSISTGDEVLLLPPKPGAPPPEKIRIRTVQVFGQEVSSGFAGDRTAVCLQGVSLDQVRPGQVLCTPGGNRPTRLVDVQLHHLASRGKALRSGARVTLHVGTDHVDAGITLLDADALEPGQSAPARLRLAAPIASLPGQRFIVRGFERTAAAGQTIGGGLILDLDPPRRRRHDPKSLETLDALLTHRRQPTDATSSRAAAVALVLEAGHRGISVSDLSRRLRTDEAHVEKALAKTPEIAIVAGRAVHKQAIAALADRIIGVLTRLHEELPFHAGFSVAELSSRVGRTTPRPFVDRAIRQLTSQGSVTVESESVRLRGHEAAAEQGSGAETKSRVLGMLGESGLEAPDQAALAVATGLSDKAVKDVLGALVRSGDAVRISDKIVLERKSFDRAKDALLDHLQDHPTLSTPEAKALTGVSRKYLIPLLETLDKMQLTVRRGDLRMRGSAAR